MHHELDVIFKLQAALGKEDLRETRIIHHKKSWQ